jgi:hypothetical protein
VTYSIGRYAADAVVGDFNSDGNLDLAAASEPPDAVAELWGNGDGTFQQARFYDSGGGGGPLVGDFNGDLLLDLVLLNPNIGVTTMLNTGELSFSPSSPVIFGQQVVNTSSASQTVQITNTGNRPVSIQSTKLTGNFMARDSCGSLVAAGSTCAIAIHFTPKTPGAAQGLITLVDSASTKPEIISLSGTGTVIGLSPKALNFPGQKVGTKSSPTPVVVTNVGKTDVTITSVAILYQHNLSKDFTESNSCLSKPLGPGATCTISVTFSPTAKGQRVATMYVGDNGGGTYQLVPLNGTGT